MKLISALFLVAMSSLGWLRTSAPQSEFPTSAPEPVNPVAWLEGHWVGDGFGGKAEEVWLAPADGTMSCIFRLMHGGKVTMYELVTIVPKGDEWVMRLKHFHADMRGWEERDESLEWMHEALGDREARFGPVTYSLSEDDVLTSSVEVDGEEGVQTETLKFRRKK